MAVRPVEGDCIRKPLPVPSPIFVCPLSSHFGVYKRPVTNISYLKLRNYFVEELIPMNTPDDKINYIHSMLIYQEETLQSTRNLHYVFQAIFLGSSLGISAVIYALIFGLSAFDIPRAYIELSSAILISFCLFTIFTGLYLMSQYSKLIYKRGIIVDFIQHLRILNSTGSLEKTLNAIFEKTPKDYVFVLCKIAERITNQNEETTYIPSHFGSHHIDSYSYKSNLAKTRRTFGHLNSSVLIYILYYNDIYNTNYDTKNLDPRMMRRKISSTRNGHRTIFTLLWIMAIFVIFIPIIFTFERANILDILIM